MLTQNIMKTTPPYDFSEMEIGSLRAAAESTKHFADHKRPARKNPRARWPVFGRTGFKMTQGSSHSLSHWNRKGDMYSFLVFNNLTHWSRHPFFYSRIMGPLIPNRESLGSPMMGSVLARALTTSSGWLAYKPELSKPFISITIGCPSGERAMSSE